MLQIPVMFCWVQKESKIATIMLLTVVNQKGKESKRNIWEKDDCVRFF